MLLAWIPSQKCVFFQSIWHQTKLFEHWISLPRSDGALIVILPLRKSLVQKETQSCGEEQGEEKDERPPHAWGQGLPQTPSLSRQQVTQGEHVTQSPPHRGVPCLQEQHSNSLSQIQSRLIWTRFIYLFLKGDLWECWVVEGVSLQHECLHEHGGSAVVLKVTAHVWNQTGHLQQEPELRTRKECQQNRVWCTSI